MEKRDRRQPFNDKFVRTAAPDAGKSEAEWTDTKLPGFHLRAWRAADGEIRRSCSVTYQTPTGARRYRIGAIPPLTLAEAREKAKDLLAAAQLGRDPSGERQQAAKTSTVGTLITRWLTEDAGRSGRGRSDRVTREWTAMMDRVWRPEIGALRVDQEQAIREAVEGAVRETAKAMPTTANRRFEVIRRAFRWAVERGILRHSPLEGMRRPGGQERPRDNVFTDDQLRLAWISTEEGCPNIELAAAYSSGQA